MHLFFDESGDYGFPSDRFDCYVQAAMICPDSLLGEVGDFVGEKCEQWSMGEVHATKMTPGQLQEVADFVAGSDLQLLASVTDTTLVTKDGISRFRLDQAARTKSNLDRYRRESTKVRGSPVPEIELWMDRQIKRAGLRSQISDGEFIQAVYLVDLIHDALQKSLYFFYEDRWRADFSDFSFIIDGKLDTKLAGGEKYLSDTLLPSLGSRPHRSLGTIEEWKTAPVHPFVERFHIERGRIAGRDVDGAIDLSEIFKDGLRFEDSREHAGLQLVDAAAYTVRKAILQPGDAAIQRTFDTLRGKLATDDKARLQINRLQVEGSGAPDFDRYGPLYGRERP